MKKFVSLLLALLLCLSLGLTAVAEENVEAALPELNLPITLENYQAAYNTLMAELMPAAAVSWVSETLEDGQTAWMARIDNAFVSALVLAEEGLVSEVAVLLQSDVSEDAILSFLSMASYSGAALLVDEEVPPLTAFDAFTGEVVTVFSNMLSNVQTDNIYGLPGVISVVPVSEEIFQFYFILELGQAQAE